MKTRSGPICVDLGDHGVVPGGAGPVALLAEGLLAGLDDARVLRVRDHVPVLGFGGREHGREPLPDLRAAVHDDGGGRFGFVCAEVAPDRLVALHGLVAPPRERGVVILGGVQCGGDEVGFGDLDALGEGGGPRVQGRVRGGLGEAVAFERDVPGQGRVRGEHERQAGRAERERPAFRPLAPAGCGKPLLEGPVSGPREHGRDGEDPEPAQERGRVAAGGGEIADQDRPVPQVQRVREVAEPLDRTGVEQMPRTRARAQGGGDDDRAGAADGPERGEPGELCALQEEPRPEQDRHARPAEHDGTERHPRGVRTAHGRPQPRQGHREQAARGELPQARPQVEVGERLVRRGLPQREGERGREDERQRGGEGAAAAPSGAAGEPDGGGDEDRPQHVELGLDAHGPVVLDDARAVVGGEVVDGVEGEVPVAVVEGRGEDVAELLVPGGAGEPEDGHEDGGRGDDEGGREDAAHDAGGEGEGCDGAGAFDRSEEARGDEEAGEQEEDVDAAGDAVEPDVVDGDDDDGEAAEAVDFAQARGPGGGGGRCGSGGRGGTGAHGAAH